MEDEFQEFDDYPFVVGQSQWQQVGGGECLGTTINDRMLGNLQLMLLRSSMSDEEWLYQSVNYWAMQYPILQSISRDPIKTIIVNLAHKKHKNPQALLWGYYVVEGGEISLPRFNTCKVQISGRDDIQPADVIRYARLVINTIHQ